MPGKVKQGDTNLSAIEWNRHVDAAEFVLRNLAYGNGTPRRGTAGDVAFVSVKNASGADRRQGELLEFTGLALTDLASRHLILNGGSPTLANDFGILQSPVANNDFVPDCQIAGACVALVNVLDADDRYARAIVSNYVLQSVAIGPVRILWKPSGTGEKTCAVKLLGVSGEILVKNESGGDYAANGGPRDYHVYTGTPGSFTDTGQILPAYNIPIFKTGKMGAASLLEGVAFAAPWEQ